MKKLQFKFDLNCKIAVYVPSTFNVNERTNNTGIVLKVMEKMSELFGGATSTPAKGGWRSGSGELVIEDVNIVYSYCTPEQADKSFKQILELCQYIKTEMKQEAVTLEYNNQIAFV